MPNRFNPVVFSALDLVPIGCAAFALAVGVLTRRTLPAMAATLVVLAAVEVLVPTPLRTHYRHSEHTTTTITVAPDGPFKPRPGGVTRAVSVPVNMPGGWVTSL
jgi:hypothetical protein